MFYNTHKIFKPATIHYFQINGVIIFCKISAYKKSIQGDSIHLLLAITTEKLVRVHF